jgi:hypothetical protein
MKKNAAVKARVRALDDALAGVPAWVGRLERDLALIDPHAGRVVRRRIERARGCLAGETSEHATSASALVWAFGWELTPEGSGYWDAAQDCLAGTMTLADARAKMKVKRKEAGDVQ